MLDIKKDRIKLAKIIKRYIENVEPCFYIEDGKAYLRNSEGKKLIKLEAELGTGFNAVAYTMRGMGLGRILKMAAKIMCTGSFGYSYEATFLEQLSKIVEDQVCPHFPLFYTCLECDKACIVPGCPENTKRKYKCLLNELADTSFDKFLNEKRSYKEVQSISHQMYIALYFLHKLGWMHNDVHPGNVLLHKIKPGGYWQYKVDSYDFYIENKGWLAVLWDFDSVSKMTDTNRNERMSSYYMNEYSRLLITSEKTHPENVQHVHTLLKARDNLKSSCALKTLQLNMKKPVGNRIHTFTI